MTAREAQLIAELSGQLARHYPQWAASDLAVVGAGLSFLVCRAATAPFGTVAIRLPWERTYVSDNDDHVSARHLLQQEAGIAAHLAAHGLPVPTAYALHLGDDGFDFQVSALIDHDRSQPDARDFGALMRAVHTCPPPAVPLVEQTDRPFGATIAARIVRRAVPFARLTGHTLPLPSESAMAAILAAGEQHRALLHMDARAENLFMRSGRIVAIADWGNALLGDPALELTRMAEWGHLDAAFLDGYGDPDPFSPLPRDLDTLYRLDAVLVLALVFLSEAPDPAQAAPLVARARTLAATLH